MRLRELLFVGPLFAGLLLPSPAAPAQVSPADSTNPVAAAEERGLPVQAASAPALGATASSISSPATPASEATAGLSASAIMAAASAVRADPLLGGEAKVKYLRFKGSDDKKKTKEPVSMAGWWRDLLGSLSTGMRVAMWLVGAGLLIWVVLRLRDWVGYRAGAPAVAAVAPTHVGSLDIRPESLPEDIGAAARALWERSDRRAALSLLYRGALSRLVHGHGVPIRAASTESECLSLAATRLTSASHEFLRLLVGAWQRVAYAQRELPAEVFEQLCSQFDERLAEGQS